MPNGAMMDAPIRIFGDWGTSRLRLYLRQGKSVLDGRDGPGVGALTASPEATFLELIKPWREARPESALLCGMVGSRNGWVEAPYASCPAGPDELRARMVRFEADGLPVAIVPGLSCVNPLGGPDVLRGEETQIFGALAQHPDLKAGRHLLALPGTHTKWAVVEDGRLVTFLTAPVGELFALLRDHSTLAKAAAGDAQASAAGFALGLKRQAEAGPASLPHLLFETRSRQLLDGLPAADAMGFLSGLLIGADVAGAAAWFGDAAKVVLIGDPALTDLYAKALAARGVAALPLDGEAAVLAGLLALSREPTGEIHALA
ncbi:MAG: 2-dehydro-3-deoxygalactonokinase [Caulobacter sp.]|nr:2-dehydro-3-deoxygalactonokinase [Caulobacter sp.]